MGGRRGYSLKAVLGDLKKVREEQKDLLVEIKNQDVKGVVKASAKMLAKSDKALDAIAQAYLFANSLEPVEDDLKKKETKDRRREISKKWTDFRKEHDKKFDSVISRSIVDSATRILGGEK